MPKLMKKRSGKIGLLPGTPFHIGERKSEKTRFWVFSYDDAGFYEKKDATLADCVSARSKGGVVWINAGGLSEARALEDFASAFGLHPLVLEDIMNTDQRPKLEDYGDYLYVVVKMLGLARDNGVETEQVSLVLGPDFVISFQENGSDVFDHVRERIRGGKGLIRTSGPDYLAYSLVDAVVDNYFIILEKLGEEIERLEDELITNPAPKTLRQLHRLKREMLLMRKAVWPLREVVSTMERAEFSKPSLVRKATKFYLRDVYDHSVQIIDNVETYREMLSGMVDIYLSSVSNRLNEVMKFLTVVGTIFMPLTFIAGVYGMNFRFMPELTEPLGYPAVLALMLLVGLVMLFYFRRRRWI